MTQPKANEKLKKLHILDRYSANPRIQCGECGLRKSKDETNG